MILSVAFSGLIYVLSAKPIAAAATTGQCVQWVHELIIWLFDPNGDGEKQTMGNAIADGLFGNEPSVIGVNTNENLGPSEVESGTKGGKVVAASYPGPRTEDGDFWTWGMQVRKLYPSVCK